MFSVRYSEFLCVCYGVLHALPLLVDVLLCFVFLVGGAGCAAGWLALCCVVCLRVCSRCHCLLVCYVSEAVKEVIY